MNDPLPKSERNARAVVFLLLAIVLGLLFYPPAAWLIQILP